MSLRARDCSPIESLSSGDEKWLRRLAKGHAQGAILHLEGGREDEPVVYCERDGTWWAGRYIGSIVFEGRQLEIRPRFGEGTIQHWLSGAFNLALVSAPGQQVKDDLWVPWLIALVWSRLFVEAARHGLPSFRRDDKHAGWSIKGQIDVRATVQHRATGREGVISTRSAKTLDHAVSEALVCAHACLSRVLRHGRRNIEWMPERIAGLMPYLQAATGMRPDAPTVAEIKKVRFTPITERFRSLSLLSIAIARGYGLSGDNSAKGECTGILLDVAELWELYVLAATKLAWPTMEIVHGTHQAEFNRPLLYNHQGDTLGRLQPDAIAFEGGVATLIIDAKYKRLNDSRFNPSPQREDLYQLTAYLTRYRVPGRVISGILAYPQEMPQPDLPWIESTNPWRLDDHAFLRFVTIPHEIANAAHKLSSTYE